MAELTLCTIIGAGLSGLVLVQVSSQAVEFESTAITIAEAEREFPTFLAQASWASNLNRDAPLQMVILVAPVLNFSETATSAGTIQLHARALQDSTASASSSSVSSV
jgi:hypothetical protein